MVGAFGGVGGEHGGVKLSRTGGVGCLEGRGEVGFILDKEGVHRAGFKGVKVATTIESIHISHHGCRLVDSGPSVGQQFLSPTAELVTGAGVFSDLLDGIAVANPVKVRAPQVGVDNAESPPASSNFTNKRVVVGFRFRAPPGGGEDRL